MTEKIILVFKTHFDIGFTDLSETVIREIGTKMCPEVLETCRRTAELGKLRFRWTLPAWPMRKMEEQAGERLEELLACVKNGQLVWHALPFTSHFDFCGLEDFIQGMQEARRLSQHHGKPLPIAAKMTDVPGHGRMLPALLAGAGVRFLHLGCNEFLRPPRVPPLFFWESPDGSRVLTMYSASYGSTLAPPENWPFPVWLALQHTHDNRGPQSAHAGQRLAAEARQICPGAEIETGTLDDFYRALSSCDLSRVPVVRGDLADTWIHGVGSYPAEAAEVREARRTLVQAGLLDTLTGPEDTAGPRARAEAYEALSLFGEHTWGLDVKTWLGSGRVYRKEEFLQERQTERYRRMERSWEEQRARAHTASRRAADALQSAAQGEEPVLLSACTEPFSGWVPVPDGCPPLALRGSPCPETSLWGGRAVYVEEAAPLAATPLEYCAASPPSSSLQAEPAGNALLRVQNGRYRVDFDPLTGRIAEVYDKALHAPLLRARGENGVFAYRYEKIGSERIHSYLEAIRRESYSCPPGERDWGELDNGREDYPACGDEQFEPVFEGWSVEESTLMLRYHGTACGPYGDAEAICLRVTLPPCSGELFVQLDLNGKQATPFVESGTLLFPLAMETPAYRFNKNGNLIDPARDIVPCANHVFYCLEDFASAAEQGRSCTVVSLDAPLLSLGESGVYRYREQYEPHEPTLWFNLFNNMWGTNFPQWIEGNASFRFIIFGSAGEETPCARAFALADGPRVVSARPARLPVRLPAGTRLLHAERCGDALLLRFADTLGRARRAAVRALEPHWEFYETDFFSRPLCSGRCRDAIFLSLAPWSIHTVCCMRRNEAGKPLGFS